MVEVYGPSGGLLLPDQPPGKGSFPASNTARASIMLPHGSEPGSPDDGDMWTTAAGGLFLRINGTTMGPFQRPRCPLHYNEDASQSASSWPLVGDTSLQTTTGWVMPWSGSIRGHSVIVDLTTVDSGDVTFEARIENSNQASLELEFGFGLGAGVAIDSVTALSGSVTFSRNDVIQARITETGVMAWRRVIGTIWVEFDN